MTKMYPKDPIESRIKECNKTKKSLNTLACKVRLATWTHVQFHIDMPNERQNYYNIIEFIANKARSDQAINGYALAQQYILKAGLMKFDQKATMKELHQMLTQEVFGEVDQNSLTVEQKRTFSMTIPNPKM